MPEGEYRSPKYRSQGGEDPATVAECYGVSASALLELNPWLTADAILVEGDIVVLPASHGLEGSIAGICDRHGDLGVLVYGVDDGARKILASVSCSWASVATLSPDGCWVAVQGRDGRLHVIQIADDSDRVITEPLGGLVSPRWSPGGYWIMYELDGQIHVVNADTGEERQAFPGQYGSWVGDGYRVVYAQLGIIMMRDMIDGSIVPVTSRAERVWGLAATSYGESVAYLSSVNGDVLLQVVDVFTGDEWRRNVDRGIWPWSLAWAPSGKMIGYCVGGRHLENGQAVRVVTTEPREDGECPEVEVVSDARFSGLSWSPDSRAVAISARIEGQGRYGVYAIEPGKGMFQITGTGNTVFPDWGRRAG